MFSSVGDIRANWVSLLSLIMQKWLNLDPASVESRLKLKAAVDIVGGPSNIVFCAIEVKL